MNITKTQLKQIIKEELSALKEDGDAFSHRGISAPLTTDAPGMAGVGDAEAASKNLRQAQILISQAVDFFKNDPGDRTKQSVIQRLEAMATHLIGY
jgi:hypothetical protein